VPENEGIIRAMSTIFTLTAIPQLLPEGDNKGRLECIQFIASDHRSTHKWSSTNVGTYAHDFEKIVSPDESCVILYRLRNGETVIFPGFWKLGQLKHQFGGAGKE
jgi:hypothetical protein